MSYTKHILYNTLKSIDAYVMSDEFTRVWRCWGCSYDRDLNIQEYTTRLFHFETPSVLLFRDHLYKTIISILSIIKMIYTLENGPYNTLPIPKLSNILSENIFSTQNSVLYRLRMDIVREYKPITKATSKPASTRCYG
jgi:hypothetical protein